MKSKRGLYLKVGKLALERLGISVRKTSQLGHKYAQGIVQCLRSQKPTARSTTQAVGFDFL